MINSLKENKTLQEMIVGIVISTAILIGIFFAFTKKPVYNTIGLAIGVLGAIFMAAHMAYTIEDAVLLNEKDATAYIRKMTYIRYGVACVLVVLVGVSDIGHPVMTVFGLLLLKAGAYMQPLVHRILNGKEDINFTVDENQVIIDGMQSNLDSDSNNDSNNNKITQGGE